MAGGRGSARGRAGPARRWRPPRRVVSQRNKAYVAMPFSMIRPANPAGMRPVDWVNLAGVAVSVAGLAVAARALIRIARAAEAAAAAGQAGSEEEPASPDGAAAQLSRTP